MLTISPTRLLRIPFSVTVVPALHRFQLTILQAKHAIPSVISHLPVKLAAPSFQLLPHLVRDSADQEGEKQFPRLQKCPFHTVHPRRECNLAAGSARHDENAAKDQQLKHQYEKP